MATEEFKILQKVQDLIIYSYPILTQFPKAERFSFAQDIRHCLNALLELTIEEEKRYIKKTTIQNMDIENEKLKIFIRVAFELRYIDYRIFIIGRVLRRLGYRIHDVLRSLKIRRPDGQIVNCAALAEELVLPLI